MSLRDDQVLILSAVRTPIAKFNGQLSTIPAPELGSIVLKECLSRSKILCDQLSEIILGQLLTAGQGLNPARQAALLSNFLPSIPAVTVNMACASGLKSILLGFQSLRIGDGTFVLAGGQENMSLSPHSILIRKSIKFGNINLVDTMLNDSLIDPILHEPMGFTAERVAKVYGISRQDQDEFSFLSHFRANQAIAGNTFESETVSLSLKSPVNSIPTLFSLDEGPRTNVCLHNLSQLKPYWLTDGSGTVTPGFDLYF